MQITWLSFFGSENQGLPLRSWFVTCWMWRHIPIMTSLAVPSSCAVTQTPMGTDSGTRSRKRKFPVVPAGAAASGRATAGTTRAVPDCSTNHSSADRIVVNSYNHLITTKKTPAYRSLEWWKVVFAIRYIPYKCHTGIIALLAYYYKLYKK